MGEGGGGGKACGFSFVSFKNSLFLGAEIFRLFLKFYGESFGIQFELLLLAVFPSIWCL